MTSGIFGKMLPARLPVFFTALFAAVFFCLPIAAYAEEITYTGDGKSLQTTPEWLDTNNVPCLFPGTTAAPLSSGNKVTVNYHPEAAGTVPPEIIYGGLSKTGGVTDNVITFSEGPEVGAICGGMSGTGKAADNVVILLNGRVRDVIYGAFSGRGDVAGSRVTISGGFVKSVSGGVSSQGRVTGNIVTVSGGSIGKSVDGGWSDSVVADNSVIIDGGSIGFCVYGGLSYKSNATGNSVSVSGGSVAVCVYGGMCHNLGNATGNSVTISGGEVGGGVFGGLSARKATSNTITISGSPNLARAYIWGGNTEDGDAFTGNTLNFKSSGISAEGVNNFEYYNFYLPESMAVGEVMLSVKEAADFKGTILKIFPQGNGKFNKGDRIALIHSAEGVSNAPKNKNYKVKHGGAIYEFSIYTDSNNLWVEVTKISKAAK